MSTKATAASRRPREASPFWFDADACIKALPQAEGFAETTICPLTCVNCKVTTLPFNAHSPVTAGRGDACSVPVGPRRVHLGLVTGRTSMSYVTLRRIFGVRCPGRQEVRRFRAQTSVRSLRRLDCVAMETPELGLPGSAR